MPESTLHKELKTIYAGTDGLKEQPVDGFIIDVLINGQIIEIQTGNFGNQKEKLTHLLDKYKYKIVLPIPKDKYLLTISDEPRMFIKRRLSPKHGNIANLFNELIYIVDFIQHQNLWIEVLIIIEEETRKDDGRGSWRRKGVSIIDHRLINILDVFEFKILEDCGFDTKNIKYFIPPRYGLSKDAEEVFLDKNISIIVGPNILKKENNSIKRIIITNKEYTWYLPKNLTKTVELLAVSDYKTSQHQFCLSIHPKAVNYGGGLELLDYFLNETG
jgi:hypothetical protein